MKKIIRSLAALCAVCLIGSATAGSALAQEETVTPTETVLALGTGQQNYINNLRTASVYTDGDTMIVSDEGSLAGSGGEQKNGALYFYEANELVRIFCPETGVFNPKKALPDPLSDSVYCLSNQQLTRISLGDETVETLSVGVRDFRLLSDGRLYALVQDPALGNCDVMQWETDAFGASIVNVVEPAPSFATDGETFCYYGKTSSDQTPHLYKKTADRTVEIAYPHAAPTKIGLYGESVLTLSDGVLYQDGAEVARGWDSFEVYGETVYLIANNLIEGGEIRNGTLFKNGFRFSKIGSQGEPNAIAQPLDRTETWILDRKFASLVSETRVLALPEDAENAFAMDGNGETVWLACPDAVYVCDLAGAENAIPPERIRRFPLPNVRALAVTASGDCYVSANGNILLSERNADEFTLVRAFDAQDLAVASRNNRLYALKESKIVALGKTEADDVSFDAPAATSFAIDFKNKIYALAGDKLLHVSQDNELLSVFDLNRPGLLDAFGTNFDRVRLNEQTGEISLLDASLSLIFTLDKERSGAALATEIPVLSASVDPADKRPNADFAVAEIQGYPSTLLYPEDPSGKILTFGEEIATNRVYLLGRADDEDYAFVCARDKNGLHFGYLIDTNVRILSPDAPPFEIGHTGFETEVYKYPDADPRFLIRSLPKNSQLTLADSPLEGWLTVTYSENDGQAKGFVRRSAVLKRIPVSVDDRQNATTVGVGGASPLYRLASLDSEIIDRIPDRERVKIIERKGAFCYVETEDHRFGYLESRFLVEEGFANSQKIGLILLASCVVLGILTFLIRKKIIH